MRTPGSADRLRSEARGLPEGTSRRQRRGQPTAGREEASPSAIPFSHRQEHWRAQRAV